MPITALSFERAQAESGVLVMPLTTAHGEREE